MIKTGLVIFWTALVKCSRIGRRSHRSARRGIGSRNNSAVFDKRRAVLNRSVLTEKRIEIGGGVGLEMNEPYYSDMMFGAQGTYNFDETNALNVQGLFWMEGLSDYGEQLKRVVAFNSLMRKKQPPS